MTQLPLFTDQPERTTGVHVLMPCMSFACGRQMTDRQHNGWVMSTGDDDWAKVTCPDCRAIGREELRVESRRQQGNQA